MIAALTFNDLLTEFLIRARILRAGQELPVSYDDPQRDPNYCWTHNMIYPACAGMH